MKKSLVTSLIAVPLLTLSSLSFAAEPDTSEPMLLTANQMDDVTAGARHPAREFMPALGFWRALSASYKRAEINQVNISPVVIIQIGNNNSAIVFSGNFASIIQ